MVVKNNVTRMLDAKGIRYTPCVLPNEKLGALEVAAHLGVDPLLVYKTIVVTRAERGKPILALVPAPSEVDAKALAKAVGEKKVNITTLKEAEKMTGLLAGGISPLALLNKGFEVILDRSAERQEQIYISGGQRGLNILIAPQDIIQLTAARFAAITL